MITESDALARGLDEAALIWPEFENERAELLRRILERGIESLKHEQQEKIDARKAAIAAAAGSLPGLWPENYLDELRAEWPA